MQVPYYDTKPQHTELKQPLLDKFASLLESGNFVLGSEVEAFERAFADYCECTYAVGFNNGTTALHIASCILNIGPGDEVITTPFTFAATSWGISYVGAIPVYVDIDPYTFNIDARKIEAAITPKTKAISVVHLYGNPCEMDLIQDICKRYNLYLIEDAAQAHGARYKGQSVGSWGDVTAFSFYPTKNLGACGEAGALIMNRPELAERARLLRSHGSVQRNLHSVVGYNYRMEALQGAVLNLKLAYLDQWNRERFKIAEHYTQGLKALPITLPTVSTDAQSVYHLYTIRTDQRAAFTVHLEQKGIGYSTHYPLPLHLQPCYSHLGYKPGDFPEAEAAAQTVVNLPIFPGMTHEQVSYVIEACTQFFV